MGLVKWDGGDGQCEGGLLDGSSVYITKSLKMTADAGGKSKSISQVPKFLKTKKK